MRQSYLKNAALLTGSDVVLRLAGMGLRIWLANELGGEGMGLYQLVLAVYSLFVTLATAGVSVAATRLMAEELSGPASARGAARGMLRHLLAAGLVLLIAALPRLAVLLPAGVQRVDAALAARFVPRYEARLASLQAENTALHKHLAGAQIALAENDALRQWAGIERPAGRWQAARVVFRWHDHAELAGVYPVGAAVCDEQGRFAGRITEAGADRCTLTFAGYLSPAAAGFAGEQAGLLQKNWRLTGLPLPTTLAAGTVVTTADGLWLGTLAGIPAPAADGLSAEAPLTDTADLGSQVFFIKM